MYYIAILKVVTDATFIYLTERIIQTFSHSFSGVKYTFMSLLFFPGELKKTIEIIITDDIEPEDNETLMIGLVNTEGGSRILPSSDTVTMVILANDNVAGVVGFHPASRSVIAREGRYHGCSYTEYFAFYTYSTLPVT